MPERIGDGRYELDRRLGHGGMATVYSARDLKLDRPVAIKLLADNYAGDQEVRKRFSREARLAAKLDHPNVVQVFDVGEEGERPYIVMECVEGGTLADRLGRRRRSLDRDEGLRLLGQLCEGLGHAHDRKLVHRDIKPQNLLLRDSDGCLKIADFGIARAAEETTRLTRPGKVIGTDRYMAPEQLADQAITTATDVYACGVVADEMLPEARSPELREIIERCLREDPRQRFSDATALGEALAVVDGGIAGVARRLKSQSQQPTRRLTPATVVRGRSGAPRAPRRVGRRLAAALGLLALAAVGIAIAVGSDGSDEPTTAKSPQSPSAVPTVSIPESGDPADQARALADFLRAQGRVPRSAEGR
jgi:serine/threonine protein kinase